MNHTNNSPLPLLLDASHCTASIHFGLIPRRERFILKQRGNVGGLGDLAIDVPSLHESRLLLLNPVEKLLGNRPSLRTISIAEIYNRLRRIEGFPRLAEAIHLCFGHCAQLADRTVVFPSVKALWKDYALVRTGLAHGKAADGVTSQFDQELSLVPVRYLFTSASFFATRAV